MPEKLHPPCGDARKTVLIIDDEPLVLEVAALILERSGYRVLGAREALDGIEIFRRHSSELDAVILDLSMPQLGGEMVFATLRELNPAVPIILSSGAGGEEVAERFAEQGSSGQGANGFVHKPYRPAELLDAVRSIVR